MKDFFGNPEQLEELVAYIASQINVPTIGIGGGDAPIGKIDFFEANVAPQDWLACDGTVYNIADYPQLAEHYTAVYGEANHWGGNGTTTFAVPDLRGEFLRGAGNNSHTNQGNGAAVGEHQDGTLHLKLATDGSNKYIQASSITSGYTAHDNADSQMKSTPNNGFINTGVLTNYTDTNSVTKFTSRPTNTSFLICVKAVVAGFVYSTEERVGGTWIDGKPLYQKTLTANSLASNGSCTFQHGISNFYQLIDHSSVVWYDTVDNMWKSDFRYYSNYSIGTGGLCADSNVVRLNNETAGSNTIDWSTRTNSVRVTIWYTKTTD